MGCTGSKDAKENNLKRPKPEAGKTHCGPWLKDPEELTDFPTFPEKTNSALSRALTKEIWDELKDKKDAAGVSFKTCIFSGCKNVDSGIGVYAGSHDSYTTFAPLFDKVVEDYHKHGKEDKHVSNMNANELNAPPLPSDEAEMIVSTRIRVGRNLADYPLGPGITREQRLEVMNKVVEACNTFEGDLKGKFYSLESLSEDERKQLIADHFLFK